MKFRCLRQVLLVKQFPKAGNPLTGLFHHQVFTAKAAALRQLLSDASAIVCTGSTSGARYESRSKRLSTDGTQH
ncbi:MAG: hypothetical protein V7K48_10295 [Nostoc sp.]|uniref:hypothetical protein n=1 Tax=Nostoc sp. TaxID=1180 RepID=UPI002FFB7B33